MKTAKQCYESGLPYSQFLQVGDKVDESITDYFIEVLPPITWSKTCIQMGEPYNHNDKGQAQYLTLENNGEGWEYAGIKPRPQKPETKHEPISAGPSRSARRQLRLNKAARSYAKNFKSGKTGVRYN